MSQQKGAVTDLDVEVALWMKASRRGGAWVGP